MYIYNQISISARTFLNILKIELQRQAHMQINNQLALPFTTIIDSNQFCIREKEVERNKDLHQNRIYMCVRACSQSIKFQQNLSISCIISNEI